MNREYESRAFDAEIDPPVTARSLAAAAALLAAIAAGVAGYRLASPAEPPKPPDAVAIDMTVVVDENLDKPPDDLPPVKKPVEPPPEPPKPDPPKPDPPKPVEPPKALPAVEVVKPPEKPKETVKPKPPEPPKKPEKPKFEKGRRIKRPLPPPERKVKAKPPDVRAALGGNGPRTDARLPDVDKWLALGARPGARNIVTDNEASRCLGLIKRQFYDKWNPPAQDSRIGKPRVTFRLDSRGFISSPSITQSSGSKEVDDSAISALRQVGRFTGLSSEFISSYGGSFTLELEIR